MPPSAKEPCTGYLPDFSFRLINWHDFSMNPSLSKFYQNAEFRPVCLIFPQFAGRDRFLNLLQLVKILNEICFFFANSMIRSLISGNFYV